MGEFVQQVIATLTSFPGNLVYHLILAFSVAGAFQAAMNLWRTSGFPQGRRMVLGLGLLLVARIILFIGAIVDGKVIADPPGMLPVLERSLTALGLILIVWLWAFPEPMRLADAATSVIAILTISGAALSGRPHDYDTSRVLELYQDALTAWRKNPIAWRIVSITTDYVVGDYVRISSPNRSARPAASSAGRPAGRCDRNWRLRTMVSTTPDR